MECTQRLECTQELYETHTERTCPEQIGFLGICGAKHPVVKGPNKIGRDPQTCNIILNLNSVSRQHAVINVLNSKEYMLMDLDSANKTKLQNKTLQPYIPHPIRDGDTVQFGDIFGIFRLLEEDDALPMTQALDIPETPVVAVKHVTKLHKAPTTVIPESPDVSDRDDSFVTPQPKGSRSKLSSSSFLKLSNNKTQTLPGSSPKTNSNKTNSKLSTSLSFVHNPNTSLNESFISLKCDKNVAEAEDIHEAATQAPNLIADESADSIYTADTQIPPGLGASPSIHSLDTQVPPTEHLPQVRKIDGQHEMQFDIYAANKENNRDIFNAETQPFGFENHLTDTANNNKNNLTNKAISNCSGEAKTTDKSNTSEEELSFEEINDEMLEDFSSQNILEELPFEDNANQQTKNADSTDCNDVRKDMLPIQKVPELSKSDPKPSKRIERAKSDSSTDCEDINIAPTQVIPVLPTKKDIVNEETAKKNETNSAKRVNRIKSDSSTDCEDIDIAPTQIILALPTNKDIADEKAGKKTETKSAKRVNRIKSDSSTDCEDIDIAPTQIIPALPTNKDIKDEKAGKKTETKSAKRGNRIRSDSSTDCDEPDLLNDFDLTQKIPELKPNEDDDVTDCEDDDIEIEKNKPPKVDLIQDDIATQVIDYIDTNEDATNSKKVALEDQATQIIDEVVPKNIQKVKKPFHEIASPFKVPFQSPKRAKKDITKTTPKDETDKNKTIETIELDDNYYDATQDIYKDLCSQKEDTSVETAVASNADDEVVPCSVEDYKVKDKFANIERDLTPTKNKEGAEKKSGTGGNDKVANLKKMPSDSSDPECTPKKFQFIFTDSDLPDSQEIKTSMMSHIRTSVTESSSDSEPENCTEEFTPYLNRKKKNKPPPKVDLTKMFEKLPERVITRQRKPTFKLLNAGEVSKNSSTILKPTFLTEQEDQIDSDIITENIKRLKTFGKGKNNKDSKIEESKKEEKKESTSRKKAENKSKEPKEKIKVKIEKPKRKDTKSGRKSAELEKNNTKEDSLDSTSADKPTTRRTRSKKKENDSQNSEKRSVSPEVPKETDNERKRTNKKQEKERSASPEIEIRRSKRNQKSKDKSDDSIKAPVSILKKSIHEQSTVYNISSSSSESPKSLKRSLVDESDAPSSKRTRSQNASTSNNTCTSINNASLRATPARVMKSQRVLLTAFPSAEVKQRLEKLGAVIVTEVLDCSVVLTMQIKRTFKLLCAVGLGRPIVGPGWVQACVDTNIIVDPWLYLIKDEQAEKRFHFDLQKTLTGKRNFLQGYSVSSTPSVQPNTAEMKMIVECSGGFWREGGAKWVCVSCSKDSSLWPALRKRGATVVSTEFILGGVLRQKVEIDNNTFP